MRRTLIAVIFFNLIGFGFGCTLKPQQCPSQGLKIDEGQEKKSLLIVEEAKTSDCCDPITHGLMSTIHGRETYFFDSCHGDKPLYPLCKFSAKRECCDRATGRWVGSDGYLSTLVTCSGTVFCTL
ncbi:MAG: hypothetical protein WC663_01815 [Patescibacteria group bacterium]|jgi:hypothetical protein